jgi:high affinity Mn2+ porin
MHRSIAPLLFLLALAGTSQAQVVSRLIGNDRLGKKDSVANWTIHGQMTAVYQYHPSFEATYSGSNSLSTHSEGDMSLTATIFLGRKLWKGAVLFINPELAGGQGLSHTTGMAGFPNGEIYRVGNPTPTPFIARAYFQQTIALNGATDELQTSDINQLAGKLPDKRIILRVGKFCISDLFDHNTFNHDARSQFLNWSLMAHGAWDFPADVRGYTEGAVFELITPKWEIRAAGVTVPTTANGSKFDWQLCKANSETIEGEKKWKVKGHAGSVRATGYISFTKAVKYRDAINAIQHGDSSLNNIISGATEGTNYGGVKYGFCLNAEQELTDYLGVFARASWNDGHSASWAFTEIDNSFHLGMNMKGKLWKRPTDNWGLAEVVNGISKDHQDYLSAGGKGFIIGDGHLNYGHEFVMETYYRAQLASFLSVSLDYQFCLNPAYNMDRGPVHIIATRVHFDL